MDHKKIAETREDFPKNMSTALTADEAKELSQISRKKRLGAVILILMLLCGTGVWILASRSGAGQDTRKTDPPAAFTAFPKDTEPIGCIVSVNDTHVAPLVMQEEPSLFAAQISVPRPQESFNVYAVEQASDNTLWFRTGENAWISDTQNAIIYLESAYASWFSTGKSEAVFEKFDEADGLIRGELTLRANGTFDWMVREDDGNLYLHTGTFLIGNGRIEGTLDGYPVYGSWQRYVPVSFEILGENEVVLVSELDHCETGTVLKRTELYYPDTVDQAECSGTLFILDEEVSVVNKPIGGSHDSALTSPNGHIFPVYYYSGTYCRIGDHEWVNTEGTEHFMFYGYDEAAFGWFGENSGCLFTADDGSAELWLYTNGTAALLGPGYASNKDDMLEAYYYYLSVYEGHLSVEFDDLYAVFALDGTDRLTLETDLPSCPAGTGFTLKR